MFHSVKEKLRNSRFFSFNVVERKIWVVEQASLLREGSDVLDVGAGPAPYRNYFGHCNYKTQDFGQLDHKKLGEQKGYAPIDIVSLAHEIPVPDASFDAVIITEVLEHVPNPIEVVKEVGRITRPGGKLILTAPLGSGLHQQPYHFYGGYTPFWYEKFLTEAGFTNIVITPNGNFFKFYGQETQRFIQFTSPFALSIPFLFKILWFPFWILLYLAKFIVPFICHYIDKYDNSKLFTIGYHVSAVKK